MEKTDYSKIDFNGCELPKWISNKPVAEFKDALRVVIRYGVVTSVIAQKNGDGKWYLYAQGTIDELKELDAICQKVDTFIASELARVKLEEEYPMSAEQAREFLRANPGEHRLRESNGRPVCEWWFRCDGGIIEARIDDTSSWFPARLSANVYRYRLLESRPAKRVVKMTCLELCRRMVAEPGMEFQVAGQCKYLFNPTFCAIEYSRGSEWVKSENMGLDSDTADVELNESEAVKDEKPETVELGTTVPNNEGDWCLRSTIPLPFGKWRITATRVTE